MILGITGTNGAGKGSVVEYLTRTYGFKHYSARDFLMEKVDERGLTRDRSNLRLVANDLRKEHGPEYVAKELLARAQEHGGNAILESIRTLGEARFLRAHGAKILGVDADRNVRFKRSVLRKSETDNVTFEEFCMQEDHEMSSSDAWDMNVFGVLELADAIVTNNGTYEELYAQIDRVVEEFTTTPAA